VKKTLYAVVIAILVVVRSSAQITWIQPPITPPCFIEYFYWPAVKPGEKVWLHFDEVDRPMVVYVNGKIAGTHPGGFGPFSMDITDRIKKGDNEIIIPKTGAETRQGSPVTPPLTGITAGQPGGM
jgi:Glycosyl hydrolases family 2, sugar binding domain